MTTTMMIFTAAMVLVTVPAVEAQSECVSKIVPCFRFMDTTTKPSMDCCNSIKEAVEKDFSCLCTIYNTPGLLAQFNVTTDQALSLNRRCGVNTDLSACSGSEAPPSPPLLSPPSAEIIFPPPAPAEMLPPPPAMSRSFKIENKCEYTIWPATYGYKRSLETTGFVLEKGETRTIKAPPSWTGRFWGRTICSTNSTGAFSCATGDCASGKIKCLGNPIDPTTVAEFNLASYGDYYVVNVIDGYNLPLLVTPENKNCRSTGCVVDMNETCPSELMVNSNSLRSHHPIACMTTCQRYQLPELCCVGLSSGMVVPPGICKRTIYSRTFNQACPSAYSYIYDFDNSSFTCPYFSNFVITFCPSSHNKTRNIISSTVPRAGNVDGSSPKKIRAEAKGNFPLKLKLILGVSSVLATMIIIVIVVRVRANNTRKSDWNEKNMEAVVMMKRFSYVQVKKMTKSFANVLGKGGFGTVYKGKLPDGSRDVAVKILKESNGNGEDFINEIASMSRTSHANIVSLLGFCYEGRKKAIIYEFMPNGSLDKFISEKMSAKMEWKTLYNIAVGVSHGLEYLHSHCVSRIVHFDIKPQNILMDGDFCPKISDFGLAKLCKNNESIMSMLHARGTIGYIAPEVFSQSFGGVSHKSDVYSYGMVVLEMIGARNIERAQNFGSNNTSMYFPDWIYKDLEKGETMSFLEDQITEEEDEKIVKKMVLVGLWCIQTNPYDRPPMSKVVEMLEGSLEALQIPPKPLLCLPEVTIPINVDDIQETSSFLKPSQDTSYYSEQVVQDIVEENQDSSRSS
ncbi:Protein kinase domain [Arabidopsis thaliana x Arabidopsis arenosa]|uniref:Protein kinase domain n=1 Tax=Arabidopsis thaliana x Arabidopsis arenosa TaxID=1240361 RepID=A0A8T2BGQ4_9BRAS|nr:Protein kinase domain [Arabidopsis thaliana x Arabidopsis arenosa]KAG7586528.1 Protein kinase domain [Arabidopsis thaliana x Arabidopsis arenosa]